MASLLAALEGAEGGGGRRAGDGPICRLEIRRRCCWTNTSRVSHLATRTAGTVAPHDSAPTKGRLQAPRLRGACKRPY